MALKATVFRVALDVADLTRDYYAGHELTVARHPSETDERMLYRLVAFALHAHEELQFTRGLSTGDEPDLWRKDLDGGVAEWIELGQPDLRRLRRACGVARRVWVYSFDPRAGGQWWSRHGGDYRRFPNLGIWTLATAGEAPIAALVARSMALTATIAEDRIWLADAGRTVEVARSPLKAPA